MTVRAAATPRAPGAEIPAPRRAARLLAGLRGLFRTRRLDAGDLTDRQLADVGLTRADLPDDRGWRR